MALKIETESLRRGLLTTATLNGAAQLAGLATVSIMAALFGASSETDVYLYALSCLTITTGLASAINAAVVLPESMRLRAQEHPAAAMGFVNVFTYAYGTLALAFALTVFFRPEQTLHLLSRFDPDVLRQHRDIIRWMAPVFLLDLLCWHLGEVLASLRIFTLAGGMALLNRCLGLVGLITLHKQFGLVSILAGSLAAYIIQFFVLLVLLRRSCAWNFRPRLATVTASCRKNMGFAFFGQLTSALAGFVPQYLVSGLDQGLLTALNFAQRIVTAPQSLLLNQFSVVTGIKLNEMQGRRDAVGVAGIFDRANRTLLVISCSLALLLALNADLIVTVLFHRGAFDAAAAAQSADLLRLLALSLPLLGINTLVARLFMSAQKIREAVWFQTGMGLLNIVLTIVGVQLLGVTGFPISSLVFYLITILALVPLMKRVFPDVGYPAILRFGTIVACILAALALCAALAVAMSPSALRPAAQILMSACFAGCVAWLNHRLGWSRDLSGAMATVLGKIRPPTKRPA